MVQRSTLTPLFAVLAVAGTLLAGCSSSQQTTSDPAAAPAETGTVVARIDGAPLMLEDFEREYARSVGGRDEAADDSLSAYQDFLERYVDYRLKVLAAEAAGLSSDSTIQAEIRSYRGQLARPYLMEREVTEPLLRDLYEKSKQIVDASHILIRLDDAASPDDTLEAYQKIAAIQDSLAMGVDFGELALRNSEDPSARNEAEGIGYKGRLGFFTAGQMIQAFEDEAYATPVGETSDIFRTRFGYHILQVHERKERPADVRISHIMIRPDSATAADTAEALAQVAEVQRRLAAGEAFADLAQEFSDDRQSAANGGDLGMIPFNSRLISSMKEAAFALENVGDVSDPIQTNFGYHLIQLTDRQPIGTFEEEQEALNQTVSRLPRARAAQEAYTETLRARHGVTLDTMLVEQTVGVVTGDSLLRVLRADAIPAEAQTATLFTVGDSTYTFADVQAFFAAQRLQRDPVKPQVDVFDAIDQVIDDRAVNYEIYLLEDRDPEFARTMKEFRDGLLLFRVMEDSVWTPASQDSAGLAQFYQGREAEYQYPTRTRVLTMQSRSDSLLNALTERLRAGETFADLQMAFADDQGNAVRFDTTFVEKPTGTIYDRALTQQAGGVVGPVAHNQGFLVMVNDGTVPPRQRTFQEARTLLINDYQERLEDELMEELRQRYDVVTYPSQLTKAFDDAEAASASSQAMSE